MPSLARPINFADTVDVQWSGVTSAWNAKRWFLVAMRKIVELAALPEDWDGYGSRPIQPAAIRVAAELLGMLSEFDLPSPQIFPVSGGGIQLEWQNAKCELELEILPDGSLEFLIADQAGEMREGRLLPLPHSNEQVYRLVYWFKREQASVVLL
jgi:hypothetical protein